MTEKELLEIKKLLKIIVGSNNFIDIENLEFHLEKFVKPKPEFNQGERVIIYEAWSKYKGTILKFTQGDDMLFVELDNGNDMFVHKKQCRRLKEKHK